MACACSSRVCSTWCRCVCPKSAAPCRVLVINPNINTPVTARVREVASRYANDHLRFEVVNPWAGPFSIESDEDKRAAEQHALQLIAQSQAQHYDGYVLACFDDMALEDARNMVTVPVIGCCEAGIAAARLISRAVSQAVKVDGARVVLLASGVPASARVADAWLEKAEHRVRKMRS